MGLSRRVWAFGSTGKFRVCEFSTRGGEQLDTAVLGGTSGLALRGRISSKIPGNLAPGQSTQRRDQADDYGGLDGAES